MSDAHIETLLRQLTSRRGILRLLRRLGFSRAPLPVPQASLPPGVRAGWWTDGDVLRAHVLEYAQTPPPDAARIAARWARTGDPVAFHLVVLAAPGYERVTIGCTTTDGHMASALLVRGELRHSDVEIIEEMTPRPGEAAAATALRFARALDRSRLTGRFFRDITGVRDAIAAAWHGVPPASAQDRGALALLLLSRLLFLWFLQQRGQLGGDREFLPRLLREWRGGRHGSFYRRRLRVLFFAVLNRRPDRRCRSAATFGALPYLNGGLFEQQRLERRYGSLDLPDDVVRRVFADLLQKYRFTSSEAAETSTDDPAASGIDPEMLGRIFEGLMPGERRARTGTFYTPARLAHRVAAATLQEHLDHESADPVAEGTPGGRRLRILDPACGSGAFLMAALLCLTRSGGDDAGAGATRREVVGHSLYGVDLLDDAALICSLRLWLALLPAGSKEPVEPLPNLDRRVRQGDALVDPLELGAALPGPPGSASEHARIRRIIRDLTPLAERYLNAEPRERTILRRQIGRAERRLASSWVGALTGSLARTEREMRARSADRDLFGEPAAHAVAATRSLPAVLQSRAALDRFAEDVADPRSLPFFSFRVHFPEAAEGFDLILSNPPWVRSHDWPAPVKQLLRETYTVCRYAGWPEAARLTGVPAAAGGQVDLALLFLERCAGLLAPHGTLGLVLPAKLFRSLAAGGARRLLRRDIVPAAIEDHSLDHRGIFEADAFPAVLLARKPAAAPARTAVRITLTRAGSEPLAFEQSPEELPLHVGDDRAPWLLAPTECLAAFRHMQRHPPIGDHDALHVRRGAITGCNAALVLRRVEPKLGELARIEAEGAHGAGRDVAGYRAHVEASAIRPVLRGTDVRAWSARVERHVIWVPANDDPAAPTPPRMQRYLQRHRTLLRPAGTHRLGCLERVGRHTLGHKVVWSDLSRELRAAAVPALTRSALGTDLPLIPLNSVYFIATSTYDDALLLAAYMNSTVFGTFARAAAERAKDAHFRFFAWTIAALPLPRDWRTNSQAPALTGISSDAHRSGGLAPLDRQKLDHLVAQAYSLGHEQQDAIAVLARWFDGARSPEKQPPRTLPGDSCDESA